MRKILVWCIVTLLAVWVSLGLESKIVYRCPTWDICMANDDGTNEETIVDEANSEPLMPFICADGLTIAFFDQADEHLYVVDTDGSNLTDILDITGGDNGISHCWKQSGIGQYTILFNDGGDVWSVELDGTDDTELIKHTGAIYDAEWCGSKIIYSVSGEVYIADDDGSNERQLTCTDEYEFQPSCSPRRNPQELVHSKRDFRDMIGEFRGGQRGCERVDSARSRSSRS